MLSLSTRPALAKHAFGMSQRHHETNGKWSASSENTTALYPSCAVSPEKVHNATNHSTGATLATISSTQRAGDVRDLENLRAMPCSMVKTCENLGPSSRLCTCHTCSADLQLAKHRHRKISVFCKLCFPCDLAATCRHNQRHLP